MSRKVTFTRTYTEYRTEYIEIELRDDEIPQLDKFDDIMIGDNDLDEFIDDNPDRWECIDSESEPDYYCSPDIENSRLEGVEPIPHDDTPTETDHYRGQVLGPQLPTRQDHQTLRRQLRII